MIIRTDYKNQNKKNIHFFIIIQNYKKSEVYFKSMIVIEFCFV